MCCARVVQKEDPLRRAGFSRRELHTAGKFEHRFAARHRHKRGEHATQVRRVQVRADIHGFAFPEGIHRDRSVAFEGSGVGRERRRAEDLATASQALHARIHELTNDRNTLKAEHDAIAERYSADQQRLTAAVASATQTAIESEARMRSATTSAAATIPPR